MTFKNQCKNQFKKLLTAQIGDDNGEITRVGYNARTALFALTFIAIIAGIATSSAKIHNQNKGYIGLLVPMILAFVVLLLLGTLRIGLSCEENKNQFNDANTKLDKLKAVFAIATNNCGAGKQVG
ncbi:MAG: hypothetical protein OEY79_04715 [Anaplasmataceae bacterium]|nr:hypothetical protein [Anaplasmataceae bacterium]